MKAIMMDFEKLVQEQRDKESIFCPYCGHKEDNETMYDHVTVWGDGDKKPCECEQCGRKFMIEERVTREFETSKIVEGEDENRS